MRRRRRRLRLRRHLVHEVGGRGSSERGVQSARVRGELIEIAKERRIKLVVQRGCAEVAKVAEGGVRGDALGQARVEVGWLNDGVCCVKELVLVLKLAAPPKGDWSNWLPNDVVAVEKDAPPDWSPRRPAGLEGA